MKKIDQLAKGANCEHDRDKPNPLLIGYQYHFVSLRGSTKASIQSNPQLQRTDQLCNSLLREAHTFNSTVCLFQSKSVKPYNDALTNSCNWDVKNQHPNRPSKAFH